MRVSRSSTYREAMPWRLEPMREMLAYFGGSLGLEHVARDPNRRAGIQAAMEWLSIEIAWEHALSEGTDGADYQQAEVYAALEHSACCHPVVVGEGSDQT